MIDKNAKEKSRMLDYLNHERVIDDAGEVRLLWTLNAIEDLPQGVRQVHRQLSNRQLNHSHTAVAVREDTLYNSDLITQADFNSDDVTERPFHVCIVRRNIGSLAAVTSLYQDKLRSSTVSSIPRRRWETLKRRWTFVAFVQHDMSWTLVFFMDKPRTLGA